MDAARAKGADELRRWEELYRPTPVIAPLAGSVISRKADPGQTVTAQDAIFVMSDRLIVRASVDETDIARIRLRQRAQITLDAYPDHVFAGTVEQIAFDAKTVNNVTTYEVDVLSEKAPSFMRSGMTVNVSFFVQGRRGVLQVPVEAVATRGGASYVFVPGTARGAAPVEKAIQVGMSDGKRTEVIAGLAEGDKIAVLGASRLDTGSGNRFSPLSPFRRR